MFAFRMLVSLSPVFTSVCFVVGGMLAAGCGPRPEKTADSPSPMTDAHDHGHDHGHAHEGPHGGELIELGDEEYHAELVHDAASTTIYLLDSAAKQGVSAPLSEIQLNLTVNGQPRQYTLVASPLATDGGALSSRFVSNEAELAAQLAAGAEGRLSLTINNRAYSGRIEHHHH